MDTKKHLHIYIIESPSSDNLLVQVQEGKIISDALKLIGIKSQCFLAVNRDALTKAFLTIFASHPNASLAIPIIHLSCHGDSTGIQLTSNEILTWNELEKMLTPLNKLLNGLIILCMSSCEGLNAVSMALKESGDLPFLVLVGNASKPEWSETLVGFSTLYHLLGKGINFDKSVEAARMASGNQHFHVFYGHTAREIWRLWNKL